MEKDCKYWRDQVNSAKSANKAYFVDAKAANEAYSKERDYNIFYANTQTLTANLLTNTPKPDVQRRFLKKVESDKLKYNTYLETAKVSEGAISFYSDMARLEKKVKKTVFNSVKVGLGVSWIDYEPTVSKDETGAEYVSDRKLAVKSLQYNQYLESTAEEKEGVWWKSRRHLLTRKDIETRFPEYEITEAGLEFNYESKTNKSDDTSQKIAEVWEIWDKSTKTRKFITMQGGNDFLEDTKDPYKLQDFFPVEDITWLTDGETLTPIPEYKIYRNLAVQLDELTERSKNLDLNVLKFVLAVSNKDKDTAQAFINANDGDTITVPIVDPSGTGNVLNNMNAIPIDGALNIVNHITAKKEELKNDIFDITGISDLSRGQSNAQETATAQKIKGIFGSLRFQDRQKVVQDHIKKLYEIMTEIICEHWDAETLSEITSTTLPTQEEKDAIKNELAYAQVFEQHPNSELLTRQPKPITKEQEESLEQPTWDDILGIMRDDKLRNFTIDIESTSTVFDDKAAQDASIARLTEMYISLANNAAGIAQQSPELLKGFIPIMKLNLTNIKAGRALHMQLEEAIEGGYNAAIQAKEQPAQPNPEMLKIQLEEQKLQSDSQNKQAELQLKQQDSQIRAQQVQNDSRKIALEEQKIMSTNINNSNKLAQDGAADNAKASNDVRTTNIKQQDADRKDRELIAETQIAAAEIITGVEAPAIAGDVATVG